MKLIKDSITLDELKEMSKKCESEQDNLWGINLYPAYYGTDNWLEFDSMINMRPGRGNPGRGVLNPVTREKITTIVAKLVVV